MRETKLGYFEEKGKTKGIVLGWFLEKGWMFMWLKWGGLL